MNYDTLLSGAAAMAAKAKDGKLVIGSNTYAFTFNHMEWKYNVTENGIHLLTLNTKKLLEAKRLLQEYLSN